MDKLFLLLLNRSVSAGWLILAVMALRFFMRRSPRWLVCVLWAMAAVRLLCPFFPESPLSLIPSPQLLSPYTVRYAAPPAVTTGIPAVNSVVNPVLSHAFSPAPGAGINPLHVWISAAGVLWLGGFLVLLLHALVSFLRIRRTVEESVPLRENIRLCDHISSPFILGILRPVIYLPSGIKEQELLYVLAHEKAHLRQRDHWWKPLGYLLLSLYWFHPLIWAAYVLFCRDMEIACDERVIKDMDLEEKKAYSRALVSLSLRRRLVSACPLAFGESNVKDRVTKVLHYKKPAFWIIIATGVICGAAAVCFLTNPVKNPDPSGAAPELPPDQSRAADRQSGHDDAMIRYLDRWYPRAALSEDTIRWLEMYNSLPPEAQLAVNSVPWDLHALLYPEGASALETAPEAGEPVPDQNTDQSQGKDSEETLMSARDLAIRRAIMEKYQHSYSQDYDFACCDFALLEASDTLEPDGMTHRIVCYGWVLYMQYVVTEAGLESVGGCHIPAALTFDTDYSLYILKEYWTPRDGSYFVPDIRDKFPGNLAEDGLDSQKFIIRQQQSCYAQAVEATGLDTDAVIDRLLEDLASDLGSSFDPRSIPTQQNTRYRELINYGEYTLSRFLNRFEQGGEPDPKGRIMALICEELLQTQDSLPLNAREADTGRLWYETLYAHASNLVIPYVSNP